MGEFSRLRPLKLWMQKTIPAVFDDSLTYYEAIAKLMAKINEIIEKLNTIQDEWEELLAETLQESKEYTDSKVKDFEIRLQTTIEELNIQYATFVNDVNSKLYQYHDEFLQFAYQQEKNLNNIYAQLLSVINSNNEYLKWLIENQKVDLEVIDYFTGRKVTPQFMFNKLAALHCPGAITYNELAAKNLTYNNIIDLEFTYEYLVKYGIPEGSWSQLLPENISYGVEVENPVTGEVVTGTYTAEEFFAGMILPVSETTGTTSTYSKFILGSDYFSATDNHLVCLQAGNYVVYSTSVGITINGNKADYMYTGDMIALNENDVLDLVSNSSGNYNTSAFLIRRTNI